MTRAGVGRVDGEPARGTAKGGGRGQEAQALWGHRVTAQSAQAIGMGWGGGVPDKGSLNRTCLPKAAHCGVSKRGVEPL